MEVRDPVHGFVDFSEGEKSIIDHPAFQRLRRIRQLAMSDLVYPGAVHHRFEHSLGVCHIAGRIAERLFDKRADEDTIKYVRLAALLHDIGHGPFSHISETPLGEVNREWLEENNVKEDKLHECIGIDIIKHVLRAQGWLTPEQCKRVVGILDTVHKPGRSIERDIVSGPLDADKMDYLLRDSLCCGVKYGVFDLERLIRALVVVGKARSTFVGVESEDIPTVDQYVTARYDMHLQVYGHKTRRATDLMLIRAIMKAVEANDEGIVRAYTYVPDSSDFVNAYLSFTDRVLLDHLAESASEAAQKLADRLARRSLPSRVLYRPIGDLADDELQEKLRDKEKRREAEQLLETEIVRELAHLDADCVFVEVADSKEVGKFPSLSEIDPEQIHVRSDSWSEPRTLAQESNFFRDYKFTPRTYISVYAAQPKEDGSTREEFKSKTQDALKSILPLAEEVPPLEERNNDAE